MYKVIFCGNELETKYKNVSDFSKEIKGFSYNEYILQIKDEDELIFAYKNKEGYIEGSKKYIPILASLVLDYKLELSTIHADKDLIEDFLKELNKDFLRYSYDEHESCFKEEAKVLVLAGGCFWCMAKPYYEYEGVLEVKSGYAGGKVFQPDYSLVKQGETGHKEVVRITYNPKVISFKELIDVYFESIDPFDDGGQFIDRGDNYSTAIFTSEKDVMDYYYEVKEKIEREYKKEVKVRLLPEDVFYMAEDYHQDYALKNEEAFKEEERISKRTEFKYVKLK